MDDTTRRRTNLTTALSLLGQKLQDLKDGTEYANIRNEATNHLRRIDNFLLHIGTSISVPGTTDTCWRDVDAALEALTWMVQGSEREGWIVGLMTCMRAERGEIREQMIKEVKGHHEKFLRYIRGREQGLIVAARAQSANGHGGGDGVVNGGDNVDAESASVASTKKVGKHMTGVSDDKNHGPLWEKMWSGIKLMDETEDALQHVQWEELDKVKDEYKADVGDLIMETEMSLLDS